MSTLTDLLRPLLRARYPEHAHVPDDGSAIAVFRSAHPDVGQLELLEENEEVTAVLGTFTHGHFSCFDEDLSVVQRAHEIAAEVIPFLDDLFADRIEFWGSHQRAGGWCRRGAGRSALLGLFAGKMYVWSGPVEPDD